MIDQKSKHRTTDIMDQLSKITRNNTNKEKLSKKAIKDCINPLRDNNQDKLYDRDIHKLSGPLIISEIRDEDTDRLVGHRLNLKKIEPYAMPKEVVTLEIPLSQLRCLAEMIIENYKTIENYDLLNSREIIDTLLKEVWGMEIDYEKVEKEHSNSEPANQTRFTSPKLTLFNNLNGQIREIIATQIIITDEKILVGACFDTNSKIYYFNIKNWSLYSTEHKMSA